MSQELIVKEAAPLPAELMDDLVADANKGLATRIEEYAVPYLGLLQALSPQLDESSGGAYIETAKAGMIFNNVTSEVYEGKTGILVIPCCVQFKLIEWKPRDSGGGFVKAYTPDDPIARTTRRDDKNRDILPNGNYLATTAHHYVLQLVSEDRIEKAVVAMTSTALKKSRRWNTMIASQKMRNPKTNALFTPPSYANVWRLFSVKESNNQGSWYNWEMELHGPVGTRDLYALAKEFETAISAGEVEVKHTAPNTEGGSTNDIPF